MRCDEIQERFVELLYDERDTPRASPELLAHIESCPSCRKELEGLKDVQRALRGWKDEPLPSPVVIPGAAVVKRAGRPSLWRVVRYAGIAAMLVISILALANVQINWNKDGFELRTHLFASDFQDSQYYTKEEVRSLLKKVLDDSESRITETNYLMMQRMLDTIDQDRLMDLQMARDQSNRNRNKN